MVAGVAISEPSSEAVEELSVVNATQVFLVVIDGFGYFVSRCENGWTSEIFLEHESQEAFFDTDQELELPAAIGQRV